MTLLSFTQTSMTPPSNATPEAEPKISLTSNFDVVIQAVPDPINEQKAYPKISEMIYGVGVGNVALPDPNPIGFQAGDAVPDFIKLIEVTEDGEDTEVGDPLRVKIAYAGGYSGASSYSSYSNMPASTTIRINPVDPLTYGKRYKIVVADELPRIIVTTSES